MPDGTEVGLRDTVFDVDRTQTFQAGPQLSGPHNVQCSVPQGSVLGPKKFIAYTEDLASSERHQSKRQLSHNLYADDTQLLKRVFFVLLIFR